MIEAAVSNQALDKLSVKEIAAVGQNGVSGYVMPLTTALNECAISGEVEHAARRPAIHEMRQYQTSSW